MNERSLDVRRRFGAFIRERRQSLNLSVYSVGNILGVTHSSVFNWETAKSFPVSMSVLQRMELVYGGVENAFREMFENVLSDTEEKSFLRSLDELSGGRFNEMGGSLSYRHKDAMRGDVSVALGIRMKESRWIGGIGMRDLSRLLGLSYQSVRSWELGSSFPSDLVALRKLDLFVGGCLVDIIFGFPLSEWDEKEVRMRLNKARRVNSVSAELRAEIARRYDGGETQASLSRSTGLSSKVVRKVLKDAGVHRPQSKKTLQDYVPVIVERYAGGESVRELASSLDLEVSAVYRVLRGAGLKGEGEKRRRLKNFEVLEIRRRCVDEDLSDVSSSMGLPLRTVALVVSGERYEWVAPEEGAG